MTATLPAPPEPVDLASASLRCIVPRFAAGELSLTSDVTAQLLNSAVLPVIDS